MDLRPGWAGTCGWAFPTRSLVTPLLLAQRSRLENGDPKNAAVIELAHYGHYFKEDKGVYFLGIGHSLSGKKWGTEKSCER